MESAPRLTRAQALALATAGKTPSAGTDVPSRVSKTSARKGARTAKGKSKDAMAQSPVHKLDFRTKEDAPQSSPDNDTSGSPPDQLKDTSYTEPPSCEPLSTDPPKMEGATEDSPLDEPDLDMVNAGTPLGKAASAVLPGLSPVVTASPDQGMASNLSTDVEVPDTMVPSSLTKKLAAAVQSFEAAVLDLDTSCHQDVAFGEDCMDVDESACTEEANLAELLQLEPPSDDTLVIHTAVEAELGALEQLEIVEAEGKVPETSETAGASPLAAVNGKPKSAKLPVQTVAQSTTPLAFGSPASASGTPSFANPTASSKAAAAASSSKTPRAASLSKTPRAASRTPATTASKTPSLAPISPEVESNAVRTEAAEPPLAEKLARLTRSTRRASYLTPTSASAARASSVRVSAMKTATPSLVKAEAGDLEEGCKEPIAQVECNQTTSKRVAILTPPPSSNNDGARKLIVHTPFPKGAESMEECVEEETEQADITVDAGPLNAVDDVVDSLVSDVDVCSALTPCMAPAPEHHDRKQSVEGTSSTPAAVIESFSFPAPTPGSGMAATINSTATPVVLEAVAQPSEESDGMTPEFVALPKAAPAPAAKQLRTNDLQKYQKASKQLQALAAAEAMAAARAPQPYNQRLTIPVVTAGFMSSTQSSSRRTASALPTATSRQSRVSTTATVKSKGTTATANNVEGESQAVHHAHVKPLKGLPEPNGTHVRFDNKGQAKPIPAPGKPQTTRVALESATHKRFE